MEVLNDVLGYKNLKIYQNTDYFSFSLDSVFLANYSTIRLRDKSIVDFCTGNGIVPLILSRRTDRNIIGVEIQKELSVLANKSVKFNNLDKQITIINEDVKNFCNNYLNYFDLVLCNPPYFKNDDNNTKNLSYEKMVARHEVLIDLNEICYCASRVLKDNGTFSIVHRSDRFMDVINSFKNNNIEPKRIKFVYDTINSNSTLVLIEGQKAGKVGLIIDKPLIIHNLDGTYTDEYEKLQLEVNK